MQPIALRSTSTAAGTMLTVSGWGTTQSGSSSLPTQLLAANIYVNTWSQCYGAYGNELTAR